MERMKETKRVEQPQQISCRIRVRGQLGADWADWFEGLVVTPQPDDTTLLEGDLRDQPALYGLLAKVRDLGLSLISVDVCAARRGAGEFPTTP